MMKRVAGSIDLPALGITVRTTRKTRTGGILLEVDGEDKATLLAEKVRAVVGDSARVRRPELRTPILLLGIPEWSDAADVATGLQHAGVPAAAFTSGHITVRKNDGGRGDLVARFDLPYRDAITLAKAGPVMVGWTRCRVRLLEKSQPTCFRCQEKGHLAAECRGEARARCCHRCGVAGHLAKDCTKHQEEQREQRQLKEEERQQREQRPSGGGVEADAAGAAPPEEAPAVQPNRDD